MKMLETVKENWIKIIPIVVVISLMIFQTSYVLEAHQEKMESLNETCTEMWGDNFKGIYCGHFCTCEHVNGTSYPDTGSMYQRMIVNFLLILGICVLIIGLIARYIRHHTEGGDG